MELEVVVPLLLLKLWLFTNILRNLEDMHIIGMQ